MGVPFCALAIGGLVVSEMPQCRGKKGKIIAQVQGSYLHVHLGDVSTLQDTVFYKTPVEDP